MHGIDTTLLLLLILFGTVIAMLWIALPFAVFGVKPLLRQLIAEHSRTRQALEQLIELSKQQRNKPPGT